MSEQMFEPEQTLKNSLQPTGELPYLEENGTQTEPLSGGSDFIDATQSAIIDVAENVSEALTLTEKSSTVTENVPLYADAEFWVGMSFVVVVIMIAKPVWRVFQSMLQDNIQAIVDKLKEAAALRDEAQKLLTEYAKRGKEAKHKIAEIAEQSEKNIAAYREQELKNFQRVLAKKELEIQSRISSESEKAKREINASLSMKTINLVIQTLEKHLTKEDKIRLIDNAISELDDVSLK